MNIILDSISGTVSERSLNCLAFTVASFISVMLAVKLVTFKRKIYMQVAALYSVLALEPHEKRPELLQETANEVFRYLRDGRLQIKATKSFPLQDAGKHMNGSKVEKYRESNTNCSVLFLK